MLRLLLLLSLLLTGATATAQGLPGYVLTTTGDTLRGTLIEKSKQRLLLYPDGNEQPQLFRAAQVRGYGLRGKAPIFSRIVHLASDADSARFVLQQQPGAASLYSYTNEFGLLLGVAATDTLYELTALNWHVVLNRHLSSCSSLDQMSDELIQLRFSEDNVRHILTRYNSCVDSKWQPMPVANKSFWRGAAGVRLGFLPLIGFNRSRLFPEDMQQSGAKQIGIEFIQLRASGLQTMLQFDYYGFEYSVGPSLIGSQQNIERQEHSQVRTLTATAAIGRRFRHTSWLSSYINAGLGPGYKLPSHNVVTQRAAGSGAPFTPIESEREEGVATYHLDASAGLVFRLSEQHELGVNAIYRYLPLRFRMAGVQVFYLLHAR